MLGGGREAADVQEQDSVPFVLKMIKDDEFLRGRRQRRRTARQHFSEPSHFQG